MVLAPAGLVVAAACGLLAAADSGLYTWLGLPDPGLAPRAVVPTVRAVAELCGAVTVGSLLYAAFVAPPRAPGALDVDGWLAMRRAGWTAAVGGTAALALVPLVAADLTGASPAAVLGRGWWPLVVALEEPLAWLLTGVGLLLTAVGCLVALSWRASALLLVPAAGSLLPPAVVGLVATGAGHDRATDASVLHTLAAAVVTGALLSLLLHLRRGGPHREVVVRRTGRIVATAWPVLIATAAVAAAVGAGAAPLSTISWTAVIAAQLVALALAGACGLLLWRAGRVPPAAAVFLTGAVVALLLRVVLSRRTPPRFLDGTDTPIDALIGYDLPEPVSATSLLLDWRFNLIFGTGALLLAAGYLLAVRRLARRGDAWPGGRTAAWLAGCAVLLLATSSGVGRYAVGVFSVHMVGHMALSMLVPALLALGGPITLALRALPPAGRGRPPGPREWIADAAASAIARRLTHPLVLLTLWVGSFYALYLTGLFDAAVEVHWGHQLMHLHFVLVGYLFLWPLVGVDPAPSRIPHLGRLAVLLASMPFHAFFAITVMSTSTVIGGEFYRQLALPWLPDLLHDQQVGGGLAWATAELPMLLVIVALLVRWARDDEREAARRDRRTATTDDELQAYNAMLSRLAGTGPT